MPLTYDLTGKALNKTDYIFEWLTESNRWHLDLKTAKIPLLSPGRGNLANKQALDF